MLLLTNFCTLFIVTVQQDANPPDAAVDVMDFLVLQHVVHAKLKTVITPTTPKKLILRRRMRTKTLTI